MNGLNGHIPLAFQIKALLHMISFVDEAAFLTHASHTMALKKQQTLLYLFKELCKYLFFKIE
jgi:hypothetical protein